MPHAKRHRNWGTPPWTIDFNPLTQALPKQVDIAVIGGGFTGLAAAAWLRRIASEKSVAVFEAGRIGSGASGRTGGMALGESAGGDLPGLGDVLAGFIPPCSRSGSRIAGAARSSSQIPGSRSLPGIHAAKTQLCWALTPATESRYRFIWAAGPRKPCSASVVCPRGVRLRNRFQV